MQIKEISLREITVIISRMKWILLSLIVIPIVITVFITLTQPTSYLATLPIFVGTRGYSTSVLTHRYLLLSEPVVKTVLARMQSIDNKFRQVSLSDLYAKLTVKLMPKESVLRLEVYDSDPKIAKQLADTWADEYMQFFRRLILKKFEKSQLSALKNTEEILRKHEKAVDVFCETERVLLSVSEFGANEITFLSEEKELASKQAILSRYRGRLANARLALKIKSDLLKGAKRTPGKSGAGRKRSTDGLINSGYDVLDIYILDDSIDTDMLKSIVKHLENTEKTTCERIRGVK